MHPIIAEQVARVVMEERHRQARAARLARRATEVGESDDRSPLDKPYFIWQLLQMGWSRRGPRGA